MHDKGRWKGSTKLSDADRAEIVRRYRRVGNSSNKQELADEFGVVKETVLAVVRQAR
jgi:transposase-like protein